MIFVDATFTMVSRDPRAAFLGTRTGHRWCHMWTWPGNEDELHAMAAKLGLKRSWYQGHRVLNHYDLVPTKRALAVKHGAMEMPLQDWFRAVKLL